MEDLFEDSGARFSACGLYRYSLWRFWDEQRPRIHFLMLNPSTADAELNDPTIERCSRRARALGYGGLIVSNLFAYRATDPRALRRLARHGGDPIGPDNDQAIQDAASGAVVTLCAWGRHGGLLERDAAVIQLLRDHPTVALETNEDASPSHPLYLPYSLQPFEWPFPGDSRLEA